MRDSWFIYKLAIERCQHQLAQLCAVTAYQRELQLTDPAAHKTTLLLLENLTRDLGMLDDNVKTMSGLPAQVRPARRANCE
ncbi:MAG: hypothetical protein IT558_03275 [Alphaproteobacteria bacterium]|nr:hypothetical protein [Alphaproteobacteria bacterium]